MKPFWFLFPVSRIAWALENIKADTHYIRVPAAKQRSSLTELVLPRNIFKKY